MSYSSPENACCVVAVKFLGPQLSPCFYSSRVIFSKKDDMFCILGSGGHLIESWDLYKDIAKPNFRSLRFQNLPELAKAKRELMESCCMTQHLVESRTTGETFLVKLYRKAATTAIGIVEMKTKDVMVFKLDREGNAVYTQDIGDLCIFLSKSEPFCVSKKSFPGLEPNCVELFEVDEYSAFILDGSSHL